MTKLKRQRIQVVIEDEFDDAFESSLDSLISFLKQTKRKYSFLGYTDLNLDLSYSCSYSSEDRRHFSLMGWRMETDDELEKRQQIHDALKEQEKARERMKSDKEYQTFQRLKKKFEG